ncbi:unnamed protein product [Hermetia illucens]|uniref:Uncharacterized protein n=1 Tax=Hermetia illucens TaxID=343691 RepID=A0A7R8UQX5_HERIL|nr:uncharacterized protein LOC119651673 [Hermetia illucens]CAD7085000.1 unnamed protein product [Hermetia illucens]
MVKVSLFCLLVVAVISANAQGLGFFGFGGGFGFGPGVDFHNIVLQSAAAKLSAQNLPEDLQNRLTDSLARAELAYVGCENGVYWQYRRCTALEMKNALTEIKAIENELNLRNAATSAAPVESVSGNAVVEENTGK